MVALEREYGFRIENQEMDPEVFTTVASLEQFVSELRVAAAAESA